MFCFAPSARFAVSLCLSARSYFTHGTHTNTSAALVKVTEILIINLKIVEKENILYDHGADAHTRISSCSFWSVENPDAGVTFISFRRN